ncbi:matrixin family metalloprotease [Listeria booriae]|uniref:Matrixin family metalloprotease n=1 Tax=Listeria booriae TaxID=1552123 RepID=A0A7X0XKZ1_9LIST|nr:matrixin family metalloprotease [Listeria booriae]MBC1562968.1 matrixin family metalloprotease [Listeria booriae]
MKKRYLSLIIGVALLCIMTHPTGAQAYSKLGTYLKISEAKSFKTFINPTAKAHKSIILNGAKSWNVSPYLNTLSIGTDTYPQFIVSSSNVDKGNTVAVCTPWVYNGTMIVAKNEVTTYKAFNSLSTSNKAETITHEYGHGFGLGHVKSKSAIMLDVGFIGKTVPQTDDLNGIKAIYQGLK